MTNRNLTLAIDKDLLDKARVLAAIRRTSVNEMVRGFLQSEVEAETQKDAEREALLKLVQTSNDTEKATPARPPSSSSP